MDNNERLCALYDEIDKMRKGYASDPALDDRYEEYNDELSELRNNLDKLIEKLTGYDEVSYLLDVADDLFQNAHRYYGGYGPGRMDFFIRHSLSEIEDSRGKYSRKVIMERVYNKMPKR